MMKYQIKVILFTSILSIVSTAGFAVSSADGDNLFVWTKGARTAVVYSLDDLDKMTFDDNAMIVWTNKGKTDYAYGNISLLTFRDGMKPVTGAEQLTAADAEVRISYNREVQLLSVDSEKQMAGVQVCDLQGRMIAQHVKQGKHLRLSLAGLPQGVYVVNPLGTNKSVKIIK